MTDHTVIDPIASMRAFLTDDDTRNSDIVDKLRARYVTTDRDEQIEVQVKRLIRNIAARKDPRKPHSAANRRPGLGFAIVGGSGSGKTTALDRAFANHPAFPGYGVRGSGCPVLTVGAPSPCTLAQLAMNILDALGYGTQRVLRENQAWRRARFHLEANRILILHIDDCQHVMHTLADHEKQKFSDTLKNLMIDREWPVQLVLSGIPELLPFLQKDRQVRRRLRYVDFKNISVEDDVEFIADTVRDYAKKAGLRPAISQDDILAGRLAHAACYQMGLVIEILIDAIESALMAESKTLSIGDFADAYADRTLEPADLNPFLVRAWDTIDSSAIQKEREIPQEGSHPKPTTRGRRRPK